MWLWESWLRRSLLWCSLELRQPYRDTGLDIAHALASRAHIPWRQDSVFDLRFFNIDEIHIRHHDFGKMSKNGRKMYCSTHVPESRRKFER